MEAKMNNLPSITMKEIVQPKMEVTYSEAVDELATALDIAISHIKTGTVDKKSAIKHGETALNLVEEVANNFCNRIVQEKKELDLKTHKLRAFIYDSKGFEDLSRIEKISLAQQYQAMENYSKSLGDRLSRCL